MRWGTDRHQGSGEFLEVLATSDDFGNVVYNTIFLGSQDLLRLVIEMLG